MLELEFVELSKSLSAFEISRLSFLLKLDLFAKCVFQSALDQIDCEISDVDANLLTTEFLRRVNGGAASAKRIEHNVAGIAGCADDSFEQR